MKDLVELTTHCVHCGFCLESCPTFTTTRSEADSPRGRIYLIRSAEEGVLRWQEDVRPHLDRCLGCLACTTACPSGVDYSSILEIARDKLEEQKPRISKSMLLMGTTSPKILSTQLGLAKLLPGKKMPLVASIFFASAKPEADLPQVCGLNSSDKTREISPPQPTDANLRGEVYLLEGCAMRVLFPRVHWATRQLLSRLGFRVREVEQGCCGALHVHNGHVTDAKALAEKLIKQMPGSLPIIVNSAGCGSTMKAYDSLLSTPEANQFRDRVKDISEFLLEQGLIDLLKQSQGIDAEITYHDACHLAHGQKIKIEPRQLIQSVPNATYTELPESDMCCGSAGVYNVLQPQLARSLLDRKYGHIGETRANIVATGNPGCHAWIAQAAREHGQKVQVMHTVELLEASFSGVPFQ